MKDNIKANIYRWRATHKEQWADISRAQKKRYYETHRDEINKKSVGSYYLKKEMAIFRNILIV